MGWSPSPSSALSAVVALLACWPSIVMLCTQQEDVACRNPDGVAVDWWLTVKLPGGVKYVYTDSLSAASRGWSFSEKRSVSEEADNPLYSTLKYLYAPEGWPTRDVATVMYNDEPPHAPPSSYRAHAKGVLAAGVSSGFWITHSIPKFPRPPSFPFTFPLPEQRLAQSAFCLTMSPSDIVNCLIPSLMVNYVDAYFSNVSSHMKFVYPQLPSLLAGRHILGAATLSCRLSSKSVDAGGWIFSKTRSWGRTLFRDLVHPFFGVGMLHQSWRLGRGSPLSSCCPSRCRFTDINIRGIAVQEAREGWRSSADHSKWGVSTRAGSNIVCLSDLNHMASQKWRGGGALCFRSLLLWTMLNATIADVDHCTV